MDFIRIRLSDGHTADDVIGLKAKVSNFGCGRHNVRIIKLLWHILLMVISVSAFITTWTFSSEPPKYMIYLTNWTLALATATFSLHCCLIIVQNFWSKQSESRTSLYLEEKTVVFLYNCLGAISLLVTLYYWIFLYPGLRHGHKYSDLHDKVISHGLVPLLFLLDLAFFSTRPVRWQHLFHPIVFGALWILFSFIYFSCGGKSYVKHNPDENAQVGNHYIYSLINWKKPILALGVSFGLAIGIAVIHVFICFIDIMLANFWKWIFSTRNRAAQQRPQTSEEDDLRVPLSGKRNQIQIV